MSKGKNHVKVVQMVLIKIVPCGLHAKIVSRASMAMETKRHARPALRIHTMTRRVNRVYLRVIRAPQGRRLPKKVLSVHVHQGHISRVEIAIRAH